MHAGARANPRCRWSPAGDARQETAYPRTFPGSGGTPATTPKTANGTRDPRYDFYRGLALLVILYDHTLQMGSLWHPVWLEVTPYYWGLATAPSLFVCISGMVYGIVYGRQYDHAGWSAVLRKSTRRALVLYGVHVLLFVLVCLILLVLPREVHRSANVRDWAMPLLDAESNGHFLDFSLRFARFGTMPTCLDILPQYMLYVLVGPFILWACAVFRP